MIADHLKISEKKDIEVNALLEKLAAAKAARDHPVKEHQEHLHKGISEEVKRLQEVHCTEVSALKLSYQELSKNSQERMFGSIKELEGEVTSITRDQDEIIEEAEILISKLETSLETCRGLASLCAEHEREKEAQELQAAQKLSLATLLDTLHLWNH